MLPLPLNSLVGWRRPGLKLQNPNPATREVPKGGVTDQEDVAGNDIHHHSDEDDAGIDGREPRYFLSAVVADNAPKKRAQYRRTPPTTVSSRTTKATTTTPSPAAAKGPGNAVATGTKKPSPGNKKVSPGLTRTSPAISRTPPLDAASSAAPRNSIVPYKVGRLPRGQTTSSGSISSRPRGRRTPPGHSPLASRNVLASPDAVSTSTTTLTTTTTPGISPRTPPRSSARKLVSLTTTYA